MGQRFKWTLEVEVDETWVMDGFDFPERRLYQIASLLLPHAYSHEVDVRVLARPDDAEVAACMGYKSVQEYLTQRDGE